MPTGTETILVVDDEEQVRRFAAKAIAGLGYRVLDAGNLGDALRIAGEEGRIDLVLSDVVLPDVRGTELVRRVAAVHPRIRVLYMTGDVTDGVLDANGWPLDVPVLSKPFALAELARGLREAFDRPMEPIVA